MLIHRDSPLPDFAVFSAPGELSSLQLTVARLKRRLISREREILRLRRNLRASQPAKDSAAGVTAPSSSTAGYLALVQRLHSLVQQHTPSKSNVAVVSKGDPDLLKFGEQRFGWHFPRGLGTGYAGHYPSNSAGAIQHLEELRAAGAEFLVFPATAFWWFQFYKDFYHHLQQHYKLLLNDAQTCSIFDLRKPSTSLTFSGDTFKAREYALLLDQINRLVRCLLPEDAVLAVVSRGDPGLLALPGRKIFHFPSDLSGAYAGHPANSAAAVEFLARARELEAQYLLFPWTALWWLDHYSEFTAYLRNKGSLICQQSQICTIFQL